MPELSRIEARREAGLCLTCGQNDPEEGRSKCAACLERARKIAAERRAHAAAKGLCEACMKRRRAAGRGNRCNACADKYLARQLARAKAKRAAARDLVDEIVAERAAKNADFGGLVEKAEKRRARSRKRR